MASGCDSSSIALNVISKFHVLPTLVKNISELVFLDSTLVVFDLMQVTAPVLA